MDEIDVIADMTCIICASCPTPGGHALSCRSCGAIMCGQCVVGHVEGNPEQQQLLNQPLGSRVDEAIDDLIARAATSAPPLQSPGDSLAFGGLDAKHTDAFVNALIEKLKQLPKVSPVSSYLFVPKALSRRVGRLFAMAVGWFNDETSSGNLLHGESASLFLRHLDFLVARDMASVDDVQVERETGYIKKIVRYRVQLLEQGEWLRVLDEALLDASAAKLKATSRRVTAASDDPELAHIRKFEACVYKTLHGSVQAGRRILRSTGVHPSCPETVSLMTAKFATDHKCNTLAGRPDLIQKAKSCRAPKILPRLVSAVVEELPEVRAPGCSGCRNSRLKAMVAEEPGLRMLTRWSQIWVNGKVPAHMACFWRDVMGVPLKKGNEGQDVRPILIGEALMTCRLVV